MHIAWHDYSDYAGSETDYDIFYKRWNASTSLWTTTEVVSTESTVDSAIPSLAVDSFGNVHIAWHDETDYAGAGTDWDIFYKQFSGPPIAPYLSPILPNPTNIGTIFLDWNDVSGASEYYIYRSTSFISSIEGLTPIDSSVTTSYVDTLPTEGTYYYVIVASSGLRNGTHSNCEYVEYELPIIHEFNIVSCLILGTFVFLFVVMRTRKKTSKPN